MQNTAIILLAAGKSARMGQAKQLLLYNGKSLVRHSLEVAMGTGSATIILVTGANAALVENEVAGLNVVIARNKAWEEGIASSIRCGMDSLLNQLPAVDNAIFMVCDQPYVTAQLLKQLVLTRNNSQKDIIASQYNETAGTPALFSAIFFPLLSQLRGDEGAKKIIWQYPDAVYTVPFPKGSIDIDTPGDYAGLRNV